MTAAEAAIEWNADDPFAVLARTSAAAAKAVKADPEAVYLMADEIVVRTFRGTLDRPGSVKFLCTSCGAPVEKNRLICRRCESALRSDDTG